MALGALADMVNGVTSMPPRLSRRAQHFLRIANESERDRLQEVVRRASQVLGREYELAARLSRQHRPSQPLRRESTQAQQQSRQAQPSPQTASESRTVALAARAHRALARRLTLLRLALRRSRQHLHSLQVREKCVLALRVSQLVLLSLLLASLNGIHRAVHQRVGVLKDQLPTHGQIKQALRRIGRKLHRS